MPWLCAGHLPEDPKPEITQCSECAREKAEAEIERLKKRRRPGGGVTRAAAELPGMVDALSEECRQHAVTRKERDQLAALVGEMDGANAAMRKALEIILETDDTKSSLIAEEALAAHLDRCVTLRNSVSSTVAALERLIRAEIVEEIEEWFATSPDEREGCYHYSTDPNQHDHSRCAQRLGLVLQLGCNGIRTETWHEAIALFEAHIPSIQKGTERDWRLHEAMLAKAEEFERRASQEGE